MLATLRRLAVVGAIVAAVTAQVLPAQAATTVTAKCNFFSPKAVTVTHGSSVTWRSGCRSHTITSYSSNWSKDTVLQTGQTTSRKFGTKGVYKFRCRFHSSVSGGVCSGMCGVVKVT